MQDRFIPVVLTVRDCSEGENKDKNILNCMLMRYVFSLKLGIIFKKVDIIIILNTLHFY